MRTAPTSLPICILLLSAVVLGLAASPPIAAGEASAASSNKYNVVFIVADDLNTELGAYGSKIVKSPSIDKLADQGARFGLAITQAPVCKASRMSFMLGRRLETTQVWDNRTRTPMKTREMESIPEYFGRKGYTTIAFGKVFGNDKMEEAKWDHHEKLKDYPTDAPDKVVYEEEKGASRILPRPTLNEDAQEPDGRIARRAVELMEINRNRRFFMAVGFRSPHVPRAMPKKYVDMYPVASIAAHTIPEDDRDDWPEGVAKATPPNFAEMSDEDIVLARQAYYASVSFLDAQVGYLLDGLERLKLADSTIVVLFSDHGYGIGEHGLYGKGTHFMNVARVPLIISVPGNKPAVVTHPVELVSLYATLAELCALPRPAGIEGRSLAPLIADPDRPWTRYAYLRTKKAYSIFSEEFRYTEHGGKEDRAELYNHKTDPAELHNLIHDPKHADLVRELRRHLHAGWKSERIEVD